MEMRGKLTHRLDPGHRPGGAAGYTREIVHDGPVQQKEIGVIAGAGDGKFSPKTLAGAAGLRFLALRHTIIVN